MLTKRPDTPTLLAVTLLAAVAVLLVLIQLGTFDPQPIGEPQQQWFEERLDAGVRWQAAVPSQATVPSRFSLRTTLLTSRNAAGVVWGSPDDYLVVALDPAGFAAVWRQTGADQVLLQRWGPWPHVAAEAQELWLNVSADTVTIYLNRERYLLPALPTIAVRQVGVWLADQPQTTIQQGNTTLYYPHVKEGRP